MNRQQLLEEICRISNEQAIPNSILKDEGFLDIPQFSYLKEEFEKNKIKSEKWHQIVRFALSDPDEHRYMYDRLLELLLIYRKSHKDYFELKLETATVPLPDRYSYLNRLSLLHKEYFEIYKGIKNKIHFDLPTETSTEGLIRRRIDWSRVSKRFPAAFPVTFDNVRWVREFDTPENVLLILAAYWIGREARRLLTLNFVESLNPKEISMLNTLVNNTQEIERSFPFSEVVTEARKFANLSVNDRRVLHIESQSLYRIREGLIREHYEYSRLLKWIKKFRDLSIRMVSSTLTNYPLDTIKNLDTIYEAWIFFEIINIVNEKYGLLNFQMKEKPYYFEFEYEGHRIKFVYEQNFGLGKGHAWAVTSTPDFTAMENDDIIGVLDAKNYSADGKTEATNTMLAYLTNLDTNFGALFFPQFDHSVFVYPHKNQLARYHFDLKLTHYKMQPKNSEEAIATTRKMISDMLLEITNRV